jgi:hypothetical protein
MNQSRHILERDNLWQCRDCDSKELHQKLPSEINLPALRRVAGKRLAGGAAGQDPDLRVPKKGLDHFNRQNTHVLFDEWCAYVLGKGISTRGVKIDPRRDFNATFFQPKRQTRCPAEQVYRYNVLHGHDSLANREPTVSVAGNRSKNCVPGDQPFGLAERLNKAAALSSANRPAVIGEP